MVIILRGNCAIFIGSHSGKFVALDITTGSQFWCLKVPGRIESSACVSYDGQNTLFGIINLIILHLDWVNMTFNV